MLGTNGYQNARQLVLIYFKCNALNQTPKGMDRGSVRFGCRACEMRFEGLRSDICANDRYALFLGQRPTLQDFAVSQGLGKVHRQAERPCVFAIGLDEGIVGQFYVKEQLGLTESNACRGFFFCLSFFTGFDR